jgi:hypothetical protein
VQGFLCYEVCSKLLRHNRVRQTAGGPCTPHLARLLLPASLNSFLPAAREYDLTQPLPAAKSLVWIRLLHLHPKSHSLAPIANSVLLPHSPAATHYTLSFVHSWIQLVSNNCSLHRHSLNSLKHILVQGYLGHNILLAR